jgi:hypothetical protein
MPVRTRSQTKALYNARLAQVKVTQVKVEAPVKVLKVEAPVKVLKVEAPVPKVEAPLPKSKLPLGIWFIASLKKYNNLAKEISNQMLKYKLNDKFNAYREMRFEHLRVLSEMYNLVIEYFDEVMTAEPEVFIHYQNLINEHILEATNKFKYYLPKTQEEKLIVKTFENLVFEMFDTLNPIDDPSKNY